MKYITSSYVPELERYVGYLKQIWSSGIFTNDGNVCEELRIKLKSYFNISYIELLSNGTAALHQILECIGNRKEIILPAFTHVSALNAVIAAGCTPKIADILPDSLCIDPESAEKLVTKSTAAILGLHIFGSPCDIMSLQQIADNYNIKLVFDAAHAFGVKYFSKSLVSYGYASAMSFHATKIFHTAEGGAVVTSDEKLYEQVKIGKNFGQDGQNTFKGNGLNAKMSELHAALGLCVLPHIDEIIAKRFLLSERYDLLLKGLKIRYQKKPDNVDLNYLYYPVLFDSEKIVLKVKSELLTKGYDSRRYFYPSLHKFPYVQKMKNYDCPVSNYISERVLCLPLSDKLTEEDQKEIVCIIEKNL